jgi:hypothetical protein
MLSKRRLVFLSILLAFSTTVLAQAPDGGKLGSIKGRVVADGQAVTSASITVSSMTSPGLTRAVPTNDNGDFEVKGLEQGMYRVEASAAAYVSLPGNPDEEIYRVGDSITMNMVKGGVITGTVSTADNDPVVAIRVRAMMIRDVNGQRPVQLVPSSERLTDDRGVYRIFGLRPGTYVVFAGGRGFSGTGANAYDNDAPSFAPSSTRDTAEEISLGRGEERTVDIRYRNASGHAVSGNANAPTTSSSPWINIHLERVVNSEPDLRVSTFQRAGTKGFDFQGVADGDYLIWAEYGSRTAELLRSEAKRITVKGADVTGVELIAKPLASVAGAVVLEPSTIAECKGKSRPLFEETLVSLQRNRKQLPKEGPARDQAVEPAYSSSLQASPDRTGAFQLRNLAAGQYNLDVRFFSRYWYLRSLTLPGIKDPTTTDLARTSLMLKAGDRVSGVKATISEGAASISGLVELPDDRRSGRILFYVVPADKDKADDVLRHFAVAVADDGSFTLDHVPPGRYWTMAKLISSENETSSSTLRSPAMADTRVKLRREAEAAKSEIELKPCQNVRNHNLPLTLN